MQVCSRINYTNTKVVEAGIRELKPCSFDGALYNTRTGVTCVAIYELHCTVYNTEIIVTNIFKNIRILCLVHGNETN